jgi:alkanesulfonate monooxygenase SsuD/methylene tetrahydromethanopterin reductase-like flavin-dependent oxidoreductase (luciferase family)
MIEGLALCRALWTGKPVTWPKAGSQGRWKVEASVLGPTPHRPGGPPIWVAGAVKASRERVGKFFDGWFPNSPLAEDYAPEWAEVVDAAAPAAIRPSSRRRCTARYRSTTTPNEPTTSSTPT